MSAAMTHPNLIERLNRKHHVHSGTGGGSISYDKDDNMVVSSYVTDDGMRLVNPDGPEAAKAISTLTAEVEGFRTELQNGVEKLKGLLAEEEDRFWVRYYSGYLKGYETLLATLTKGEGDKP